MCHAGLGDRARWPKKANKNPRWKDKPKCCAFHEDFGHNTEDFFALRKKINQSLIEQRVLKRITVKKEE